MTVIHGETPILVSIRSAAYLTDHSSVPDETLEKLRGLDILFLDALRYEPHPTHSTIGQSLKIVETVKPKRAFFTHICTIFHTRRRTGRCLKGWSWRLTDEAGV